MLDLTAHKCKGIHITLESAFDKEIWKKVAKRKKELKQKDEHFHFHWYFNNTQHLCCLDFQKKTRKKKEYLDIVVFLRISKDRYEPSQKTMGIKDVSGFLDNLFLGKEMVAKAFVESRFSFDSNKYMSSIGIPFEAESFFVTPEIGMANAKIMGIEISFTNLESGLNSVFSRVLDKTILVYMETEHKGIISTNFVKEILLHCSQLTKLFVKEKRR